MIQRIIHCALVVTVCMCVTVTIAEAGFGVCGYNKEKIHSLTCYGPAVLKETIVAGNTNVSGPLKADFSSFDTVQVAGIIDLKNSKVKGNVTLVGFLNAEHSIFEKNLTITSPKAILKASTVKGDLVVKAKKKNSILNLICHVEIEGSVTFDGKPGVVRMTADSIIHGKINNAVVEIIKSPC